jgi:hypothetical protein
MSASAAAAGPRLSGAAAAGRQPRVAPAGAYCCCAPGPQLVLRNRMKHPLARAAKPAASGCAVRHAAAVLVEHGGAPPAAARVSCLKRLLCNTLHTTCVYQSLT